MTVNYAVRGLPGYLERQRLSLREGSRPFHPYSIRDNNIPIYSRPDCEQGEGTHLLV